MVESGGILFLLLILPQAASMSLMPEGKENDGLSMKRSERRVFQLPDETAQQVADLIVAKNFSMLIHLIQAQRTRGTLFSIYDGQRQIMELMSDGKTGRILLNAIGWNGEMRHLSAKKSLADNEWHKVIFEIASQDLELVVDCHLLISVPTIELNLSRLNEGQIRILVGQKDNKQSQFEGTLREFTADAGSLLGRQCPQMTDSSQLTATTAYPHVKSEPLLQPPPLVTPSSVESKNIQKDVHYLKHKVGYLENQFKQWRKVVQRYESQLRHVQLHQRGCQVGELILDDGDKWANDENCTECECSLGKAYCKQIGCKPIDCTHPLLRPDNCCPVCGDRCFYSGKSYEHGHQFFPKSCVRCLCWDGVMDCAYEQEHNCPILDCPVNKQQTPENQCCPVCVNDDFCAKKPCHGNATCVNKKYDRECRCAEGFFGNGVQCYDVDECLWDERARRQLGGCGPGTNCINTPGSFHCECLPGYAKLDERTCLDIVIV